MIPVSRPSIPSARSVVVTLVLLAVVSPFVVFAAPEIVGADEGYVVLSGSMEPALSPGDVVIVDASAPVSVGDVITYQTGDSVPTTHRVVGERDGGYETKGDANENVDAGLVNPDAVIGRTVITIPLVGYVILWANSPVGYLLLVVIPLVLLGVSELAKWARQDSVQLSDTPSERTSTSDTAETTEHDGDEDQGSKPSPTPTLRGLIVPVNIDDDKSTLTLRDSQENLSSNHSDPSSADTGQIAVADLQLTLLAMTLLFVYAGWNVYREFTATAAPTSISVGMFTAGFLGLVFAGAVTVSAWRAAQAVEPGLSPTLPLPDGGKNESSEESDE